MEGMSLTVVYAGGGGKLLFCMFNLNLSFFLTDNVIFSFSKWRTRGVASPVAEARSAFGHGCEKFVGQRRNDILLEEFF